VFGLYGESEKDAELIIGNDGRTSYGGLPRGATSSKSRLLLRAFCSQMRFSFFH
jgi:hypothetical protein